MPTGITFSPDVRNDVNGEGLEEIINEAYNRHVSNFADLVRYTWFVAGEGYAPDVIRQMLLYIGGPPAARILKVRLAYRGELAERPKIKGDCEEVFEDLGGHLGRRSVYPWQ